MYVLILSTCLACADDDSSPDTLLSAPIQRIQLVTDSTYSLSGEINGTITLENAAEGGLRLTLSMEGLVPNTSHAVHLHHGSCEQPRHHWNQNSDGSFCDETSYGFAWSRPKAGDVGNLLADNQGQGVLMIESQLWSYGTGDHRDLRNTVLIVHEGPEDFVGECFNNVFHDHSANAKIACGSIE